MHVGDDGSPPDRPAALLCRSWNLEAMTPPAPPDAPRADDERDGTAGTGRDQAYATERARLEAGFVPPLTPLDRLRRLYHRRCLEHRFYQPQSPR